MRIIENEFDAFVYEYYGDKLDTIDKEIEIKDKEIEIKEQKINKLKKTNQKTKRTRRPQHTRSPKNH